MCQRLWRRWRCIRLRDDSCLQPSAFLSNFLNLMAELFFNFLIKRLGKLFSFSIRWYFTPNKISSTVKICIASDTNGVDF